MEDGTPVFVANCVKCGPICVASTEQKADDRMIEHTNANPSHAVYVCSIGWTA